MSNSTNTKLSKKFKNIIYDLVRIIPVIVPAILAVIGGVSVGLLLIHKLNLFLVLLISLPLCLIILVYFSNNRVDLEKYQPGSITEKNFVGVLVLLFVFCWIGFNSYFSSQHVYTNRDPAIYTLAGAHLVNNENLKIERYPKLTEIDGVRDTSAGFGASTYNNNEIYAQGTHLLPAFLGMIGRILGVEKIFYVNAIFGGLSLLAIYGFAHLIIKPGWAFASVLAMSATLPLIYFSRDSYTEPLAIIFSFGGLGLLIHGIRSNKTGFWLLSGLTLGAGVLTRIDGYMVPLFITPFLVLYLATSAKSDRLDRVKKVLILCLGILITAGIGYLDVKYLSSGYFRDIWRLIKQELLAVGASIIFGCIFVAISWKSNWLIRIESKTRSWRSFVLVLFVAIVFVALLIRPLLYQENINRGIVKSDGSVIVQVERTHKEKAIYWVLWYIGPITLLLGLGGFLLMISRMVSTKGESEERLIYLLIVASVVCTALIYFIKPKITTDQVWASRRMLPVIMPGLVVASSFLLQEVYLKKFKFLKPAKINPQSVASILVTLTIITPMIVTIPFIDTAPFKQYGGVVGTCKSLPKKSTVIWIGAAKHEAPMSTRIFCGVPSVGLSNSDIESDNPLINQKKSLKQFSEEVREQGRVPVIGIFDTDPVEFTPTDKNMTTVANASFINPQYVKMGPPRVNTSFSRYIALGLIEEDGSVTKLVSNHDD